MTVTMGRNLAWVAVVAVAFLGSAARADEKKVEVVAEVVHVSKTGTEINPPKLAEMKAKFDAQGLAFTSYKRISEQKLTLEQGKPASLTLPNKKTAQLQLDGVKDGTAQVSVQIAPFSKVQYQLGREGSLFIDAGWHQGGKLVLVLSPP